MSKKIVLKLALNCEKTKRKAMKTLAGIEGVDSINIDEKDSKIIVIGNADPVCLTTSLRKIGFTELVSVKLYKDKKKDCWKQNSSYSMLPISYDRSYDCFSGHTYYYCEEDSDG